MALGRGDVGLFKGRENKKNRNWSSKPSTVSPQGSREGKAGLGFEWAGADWEGSMHLPGQLR